MIDWALHPPHAALRPFIDSYVCLSSPHGRAGQMLPAGAACLWIVLRGEAMLADGAEPRKAIWPVTLSGPFHRHHALEMTGHARLFGAQLTPDGWGSLIKRAAHRCADQAGDAAVDLGSSVAQLRSAMITCTQLEEMANVADAFITERLMPIPLLHQSVNEALNVWLANTPRPAPNWLAQQLNISVRQVERIANHYWGAPPRTLARKARALIAAACLCQGDDPPDPYADASHLIREVKRVTGHTPRQLRMPGTAAQLHPILCTQRTGLKFGLMRSN